jgi:hypothetical protein
LLEEPALSVKLANQARALIEAEFDARRTSQQIRNIFERSRSAWADAAFALQGQA